MAFDLSTIKRSVQQPPRIVIYGTPGIGKTTLAAKFPTPIFIPIEDGLGQLDVDAFPRPDSYMDVLAAIQSLITEEHQYESVIIDSLDKLEPLIWDHVLETTKHEKGHKVERIEEYGYGKGYVHALDEWRHFLRGLDELRAQGMIIGTIAHSVVASVTAPDTDTYDRYQLKLQKHAEAAISDWADAILFCNYEMTTVSIAGNKDKKRAVGKGNRLCFTSERPAFKAKNRFGMPDQMPMDWALMSPYLLPPTPVGAAAETPKPRKRAAKNESAEAEQAAAE